MIRKLISGGSYSDREVIEGIQAGGLQQERMVNQLFDRHKGLVIQAKQKHSLAEEEARDAYTDAVVALRRQIISGSFRGESKISTYLYRIFQNKCIDIIRKHSAEKMEMSYEMPEVEDHAQDIFHHISVQEDFQRAGLAMNKIGSQCKQLLMDCLFHKYSMDEVAQRANLPNSRVASDRKYKCLKKLKKVLEKEGDFRY